MRNVNFKPGVDLTFKSVVVVRAKLYQALMEDKSDRFSLDLSDVKHCDSAGLALLIEARKLCKKNNKFFEIIGMPTETQSLVEFCGVKGILEAV
ncbi:STAS domain-containing protein [Fluoribacter gormanii]|uniref:Phospholipid transport system transporter-binding protein n=1 Tax=Fluoribacter gormanii TaxID=464 RepID=A0A377GKT1_9GAMM|nr:STAS domain-containing protein [Fluoribacter gormanii]KTD02540.1 anti-anti-sigma factor [Fluoribacter gormanii]MCW8443239.1 STAS domain-containing protein [Fluoribacter gormanii]MCW8471663.1 STAS domain-containing protein [Fluoribacter gormanii]SIR44090.1 phospholipid transport system transporter-binding protein [Fluoribacter gormanii]STO25224.1 Predicted NTP binding protein (contains STAS domain) [Fluoribacter gormanii]